MWGELLNGIMKSGFWVQRDASVRHKVARRTIYADPAVGASYQPHGYKYSAGLKSNLAEAPLLRSLISLKRPSSRQVYFGDSSDSSRGDRCKPRGKIHKGKHKITLHSVETMDSSSDDTGQTLVNRVCLVGINITSTSSVKWLPLQNLMPLVVSHSANICVVLRGILRPNMMELNVSVLNSWLDFLAVNVRKHTMHWEGQPKSMVSSSLVCCSGINRKE